MSILLKELLKGDLYLHKYSRLRIINRDLKTNNILLYNNMSAKISDFGTAKSLETMNFEQTQA